MCFVWLYFSLNLLVCFFVLSIMVFNLFFFCLPYLCGILWFILWNLTYFIKHKILGPFILLIKSRTLSHFGIMTKWCPWYYILHPIFLVFSVWALSLRKHSFGRQKSCELKNGHNATHKCYISLGLSIFIWRMGFWAMIWGSKSHSP